MFPLLLNPLPLLLTFSAMFGVLIHDSRIDHAVSVIAVPAMVSSYNEIESALKLSDLHTHSERVSFARSLGSVNTAEPTTRPRDEDDNKYVIQKKPSANTYGSVYSWPSA